METVAGTTGRAMCCTRVASGMERKALESSGSKCVPVQRRISSNTSLMGRAGPLARKGLKDHASA